MSVKIILTNQEVDQARAYEKAVMSTPTMRLKNYTGLSTQGRYFVGELGEIAFEKLLQGRGTEYQRSYNDQGGPDDGDFIVNGIVIDVKNSINPAAKRLLVSDAQYKKHPSAMYVGASTILSDKGAVVEIHGWVLAEDFIRRGKPFTLRIPSTAMLYNELNPIKPKIAIAQ